MNMYRFATYWGALAVLLLIFGRCAIAQGPASAQKEETKTQQLLVYDKEPPALLPKASGKIVYHPKAKGVFRGAIELLDLVPGKTYMLSLNEKAGAPGEGKLPQKYKAGDGHVETYYDFKQVKTDYFGKAGVEFEVRLPPGEYEVKLFVKSVRDNYKSVLFNDDLSFEVQK